MPEKFKFFLIAVLLLSAGLACATLYEFNCAAKGGAWIESSWENDIFEPAHCDESDNTQQGNTAEQNSEIVQPEKIEEIEEPAASQHAPLEMTDPAECNASASLQITVSEPEIKDNDNETRCKYSITYKNTGDQLIWVFVHKREKWMDSEEIEDSWKNYYSLDPDESLELFYETLLYKNSGTTKIDVITDVAPIFATEGCKNTFRNDTAPRAKIGYPVEVPCN